MTERNNNGVRVRRWGQGDGFAEAHRNTLDHRHFMTDVDGYALAWTRHSERQLFTEYAFSRDRMPGLAALFERKKRFADLDLDGEPDKREFLLWLLRAVGSAQGVMPPLIYVVGPDTGPWHIQSVDPFTGEPKGEWQILTEQHHWGPHWQELGLTAVRNLLWLPR